MPSVNELRRKITSRLRRTPEITAPLDRREIQKFYQILDALYGKLAEETFVTHPHTGNWTEYPFFSMAGSDIFGLMGSVKGNFSIGKDVEAHVTPTKTHDIHVEYVAKPNSYTIAASYKVTESGFKLEKEIWTISPDKVTHISAKSGTFIEEDATRETFFPFCQRLSTCVKTRTRHN